MARSPPWSPSHVQVPGPKDMELGVPWPGGVTRVSKPGRDQRLDSFESFLNRSREPHFGSLCSPVSITGPLVPMLEAVEYTKSCNDQLVPPMSDLKITISRDSQYDLAVPEVAQTSAGGWFDPSNWLFKLTMSQFGKMDIKELLQAHFAREDRPEYGEDHVSTRGKRSVEDESLDDTDRFHPYGKQKATENHKIQERDRRDRHRVLQKEGHNCTSTAVFEMTDLLLPEIKAKIRSMPKEQGVSKSERKTKRSGKDEQLTAAAIMPHLSNILIFRLLSRCVEAGEKLSQLAEKLQEEERARVGLEAKLLRSETSNKQLSGELAQLRLAQNGSSRRSSTTSLAASMQPAQSEGWKHTTTESGYSTSFSSSFNKPDIYHGTKRPRLDELLHPPRFTGRIRLPPSPSPDCDEFGSSFSSC